MHSSLSIICCPAALLSCSPSSDTAWDRAPAAQNCEIPCTIPAHSLEAECLCVPHLPGWEELWIQGVVGVLCTPSQVPNTTFPAGPAPRDPLGWG